MEEGETWGRAGAGFGAGLYRNLVRSRAILFKANHATNTLIMNSLCDLLRRAATACNIAKNGLKIRCVVLFSVVLRCRFRCTSFFASKELVTGSETEWLEVADHGEGQLIATARHDATFGSFQGIANKNMIVTK